MRYLGWKKREKREVQGRSARAPFDNTFKIINIYVFNNPVTKTYGNGMIGVRPKKNTNGFDYFEWRILGTGLKKDLSKVSGKKCIAGIGIESGCLYKLSNGFDLESVSSRIGINKRQLEMILNDSKS